MVSRALQLHATLVLTSLIVTAGSIGSVVNGLFCTKLVINNIWTETSNSINAHCLATCDDPHVFDQKACWFGCEWGKKEPLVR